MTCRFVVLITSIFCVWSPALADQPAVEFYRDVRPILSNHCFRCHGPDGETREADLRLDTRDGLFGTASSGKPVVMPQEPEASELLGRLTTAVDDLRMPPADANLALSEKQVTTIRQWISAGAEWQDHWAYRRIDRPEAPALPGDAEGKAPLESPIDRFVTAKLAEAGLSLSKPADPVTLVRRLSFDLTGLPPGDDLVATYEADANERTYRELVERLLASPHYGERMAVYWLDLVRYADSCGYHSDVEQPISPYRDYVIESFNSNLPFDQFTREQLAGDLLPNPTLAQRIATGYNRLNKTTEEGGAQAGEYLAKSAADRVRTTAGVWLAATLGCAECHDHKYDPYTARDFYSFAAFFADVDERGVYKSGKRPPELSVPSAQQTAESEQLAARIKDLENQISALAEDASERADLESQLKRLQSEHKQLQASFPRTMITVSTKPREMRVLPRGNWLDQSGPIVQPTLPSFLAADDAREERLSRLDLADWLVDRDNPLTARVFVNRLWKLFFGAGLSRQLDDFGAQGEPPTHPELLDWLAIEFIESGWDIKHMIRLITQSQAYRQTSVPTSDLAARDPQNHLLARQSRWRLEAEFIRDTALLHSGLLVADVGGASVKPYQPEGYWEFLNFPKRTWHADTGRSQYRRGLYTHWQRTFLHPSLLAFDAPSREECTAQRAASNTPQAALTLLNDPTFVECARVFADRILAEAPSEDDVQRIDWAWRQVLNRHPEVLERKLMLALVEENRRRYADDEEAARRLLGVGQSPPSDVAPPAELAAWTEAARAILNLHESISRN